MDMVADRVIDTRRATWQEEVNGARTARTMGIASLGGATLDNEENYLIKKLFTALGVVQIENQARVCHSSTVVGLGTSFGRGGATTFLQDLQHADCIVIEGSNFAECHPVGFQWVMEAKARGAVVIHVDPRFTRTSALADLHVPIRAGTRHRVPRRLINHVLTTGEVLPRVRAELHQRRHHRARGVPRHRGPRRPVLGVRRRRPPVRHPRTGSTRATEVASASGKRRDEAPAASRPIPTTCASSGAVSSTGPAGRRCEGTPDTRRDAAAPALRVPDPQAALRPLHPRDGAAGLRNLGRRLRPGLPAP